MASLKPLNLEVRLKVVDVDAESDDPCGLQIVPFILIALAIQFLWGLSLGVFFSYLYFSK